ncbi:MAG: HNH endonuclease signature motif containing protein [Gemmatimonadota bacterium]|uniref:HNH endonuclease n=1 Tax=Candidatus Palauibacter scopulicola TaxID=3056741 RepID=UPI00239A8F44|nr:HNH endonuclease signature motif containing protein [Candidatus Palauibacter scopulicola]MDE2664206.1 HNH endonuclease signature motif containing protein [Candidatus Palauibacter scopulicola]
MPRLSSRAALAAYLRDHVGEVVESADLQAAANHALQYSRRLRELRQEGWKISSHLDRADLKPGQYVLEELPPDEPPYRFAHSIPSSLRAQVLERNGYTCQMCGAGASDLDERAGGRPTKLQVGHITDLSHGGQNTLSNLRALCSTCNQGAKNLVQEPPSWVWLLSQLRRATRDDQRQALDWLRNKFDEPARRRSEVD